MSIYSGILESYLIPANEGFLSNPFGVTHTMYIATYPADAARKYESLSDLHKSSTQIVYKNKLNALLAASLTYGNTIDRKTNVITLTPNSTKTLLNKRVTLYEVKCKKITFYKYSKNSPSDCYTVDGKNIIEYKELGEYFISDIFARIGGCKIKTKDVVDSGNRKIILDTFVTTVRKILLSNDVIKSNIIIYNHNKIDNYDDFINGDEDSICIAKITEPRNEADMDKISRETEKLVSHINYILTKETVCRNWKLVDDWDKFEGYLYVEKK